MRERKRKRTGERRANERTPTKQPAKHIETAEKQQILKTSHWMVVINHELKHINLNVANIPEAMKFRLQKEHSR